MDLRLTDRAVRLTCVALAMVLGACSAPVRESRESTARSSTSTPDTIMRAPDDGRDAAARSDSAAAGKPDASLPETAASPGTVAEAASPAIAVPPAAPAPVVKPETAPAPPAAKVPPARPAAPAATPAPAAAPAAPVPTPVAAPTPAGAGLSGRIELTASSGDAVDAAELANAVAYFVPAGGASRARPAQFTVITRNKRFDPETLVVPVGSTVAFPNQDAVLHNVFSVSPPALFDLGSYGEGQSADIRLDKTGVVTVYCNVHHSMQADILVVDTPYIGRAGKDGRFRIAGAPSGRGTLHFWHPRATPQVRALTLPITVPIEAKLVATRLKVPAHTKKDGKPYRAERN